MGKIVKGFIEIGNEVMVSDPCYQPGTWCQGIIKNMKPGQYMVGGEVLDCDSWGKRIAKICIIHEAYVYQKDKLALNWEDFEVGVDSGQAGIFDLSYYMQNWVDNQTSEAWYSRVCDETYADDGFDFNTLDDKCVVSSSGFGDGSYSCQTGKNENGDVVFVEIDFGIEDDELMDEDDESAEWNDDDESDPLDSTWLS